MIDNSLEARVLGLKARNRAHYYANNAYNRAMLSPLGGIGNPQAVNAPLTGREPFQGGYINPVNGERFHMHGNDRNHITEGHMKTPDNSGVIPGTQMSGYEASMMEHNCQQQGWNSYGPAKTAIDHLNDMHQRESGYSRGGMGRSSSGLLDD